MHVVNHIMRFQLGCIIFLCFLGVFFLDIDVEKEKATTDPIFVSRAMTM